MDPEYHHAVGDEWPMNALRNRDSYPASSTCAQKIPNAAVLLHFYIDDIW